MKAEHIKFNDDWYKDCARCKTPYRANTLNGLSVFFPKDKRKPDGFSYTCKKCKSRERKIKKDKELSRWNKYYSNKDNYKRHLIRVATRKKYGSASSHLCFHCEKIAKEWHHVTYDIDDVIPLCEPCHTKL